VDGVRRGVQRTGSNEPDPPPASDRGVDDGERRALIEYLKTL